VSEDNDSPVPGLAVIGLFVTGIIGIAVSAGAVFENPKNFIAAGIALIAAAIAFAAVAAVSFRR